MADTQRSGPKSLQSLAHDSVQRQLRYLDHLEKIRDKGFVGRDTQQRINYVLDGQYQDGPGDSVILDTLEKLGLPRIWGLSVHVNSLAHRPATNSEVAAIDAVYKPAVDQYIESTGLRQARDYLAGVDLHQDPNEEQTGQGLAHMREMLGSGARREQRLQHIAQAVEMRGSGAPNTRPAARVLPVSAARVTRKAVMGPPHAGASAPTIIAGTGLIAPAPGWHYMATGELMEDPE